MFPEIDWGMIASGMPTPQALGFEDRFNAARPQGVAPNLMQSPISPEMLASQAAARGVPPPPVDLTPPIRMPDEGAVDAWRKGVDADMGGKPGEVGAALTGKTVGAPMDIRTPVQQQADAAASSTDISAKKKEPGAMDNFAKTLSGVKAPPNPETQRISTPAAPRPTNSIKGGDLVALLQGLYGGQAGAPQLPSTLGAALRRG